MEDGDDAILIEASSESMVKLADVLGYRVFRASENFAKHTHLLQILLHVFFGFNIAVVLLNLRYSLLDGLEIMLLNIFYRRHVLVNVHRVQEKANLIEG